MRKLSPLECMKYTEAVTYHKKQEETEDKEIPLLGKTS